MRKRALPLFLIAVTAILVLAAGSAIYPAVRDLMVRQTVYTVAQVQAGATHDPAAWVGHTILVRGTAYSLLGPDYWDRQLQLRADIAAHRIGAGTQTLGCQTADAWCTPYGLIDDIAARRTIDYLRLVPRDDPLKASLRRVPFLAHLAAPQQIAVVEPAVYRIRIVAAQSCPAAPCASVTAQLLDAAR